MLLNVLWSSGVIISEPVLVNSKRFVLTTSASDVWLVFNFYGNGVVNSLLGEIEYSFWDTLSLKYKALVYAFIIIGAIASFCWLKFLYKNYNEIKIFKKKSEIEAKSKLDKDISKIMEK